MICSLDRLNVRHASPRIHYFAELVECVNDRGIASDTICNQARLCSAAQCIEVHPEATLVYPWTMQCKHPAMACYSFLRSLDLGPYTCVDVATEYD